MTTSASRAILSASEQPSRNVDTSSNTSANVAHETPGTLAGNILLPIFPSVPDTFAAYQARLPSISDDITMPGTFVREGPWVADRRMS